VNVGDKVIKDLGEAYVVLHDRVPELEQKIAELEYENEQFSIAIGIMQPENARLSKCCTQRGAMLEQIYQRLKVTDSKDPYHFGDWFDDNGVPK